MAIGGSAHDVSRVGCRAIEIETNANKPSANWTQDIQFCPKLCQ
jgi:hypothetical protein